MGSLDTTMSVRGELHQFAATLQPDSAAGARLEYARRPRCTLAADGARVLAGAEQIP
jgi:hypothetical protein